MSSLLPCLIPTLYSLYLLFSLILLLYLQTFLHKPFHITCILYFTYYLCWAHLSYQIQTCIFYMQTINSSVPSLQIIPYTILQLTISIYLPHLLQLNSTCYTSLTSKLSLQNTIYFSNHILFIILHLYNYLSILTLSYLHFHTYPILTLHSLYSLFNVLLWLYHQSFLYEPFHLTCFTLLLSFTHKTLTILLYHFKLYIMQYYSLLSGIIHLPLYISILFFISYFSQYLPHKSQNTFQTRHFLLTQQLLYVLFYSLTLSALYCFCHNVCRLSHITLQLYLQWFLCKQYSLTCLTLLQSAYHFGSDSLSYFN